MTLRQPDTAFVLVPKVQGYTAEKPAYLYIQQFVDTH